MITIEEMNNGYKIVEHDQLADEHLDDVNYNLTYTEGYLK